MTRSAHRGSVRHGSLDRSLGRLTIALMRGHESREAGLIQDRLQEIEHQFQLPITGTAGSIVATQTVEIEFAHAFIDATGQRDSPLTEPQFTYGLVLQSATPIMLTACVMQWIENKRGEITGALVGVATAMPDVSFSSLAQDTVAFTGDLHLTFSGYAYPLEPSDGEDL